MLNPFQLQDEDKMLNSKVDSIFVIPDDVEQSTFGKDNKLPSLPLPDLKHTMKRYLESVKPLATPEEYENTTKLVKAFQEGIGQKLHEKLKKKAQAERNWVEKWWEEMMYLKVRTPLLPYCSMDGVLPKNVAQWTYGCEEDQIKHASLFAYHLVRFWQLLKSEKLMPTSTADKKIDFSMAQYKRLFNTVRVPGEKMDSLISYFRTDTEGDCSSTVIIMCKGRLFSFNAVDIYLHAHTPVVWERVLREILNICNNSYPVPSIGILTCDSRTNWSKNRVHLENISKENRNSIKVIDESMFVLILDDAEPETDSDVTNCNLCGDYNNRWSDKSMSMIFYKNGRSGAVCDHTAFDGIVVIGCHHYVLTALEDPKSQSIEKSWPTGELEMAELEFELDSDLKAEIKRLEKETLTFRKEIVMTRHTFEDYGKLEIQRLKFHPDSYVQMSLQLAYFAFHNKPATCYETATTRKFYNGRTETIRPCTSECLEWVISMLMSDSTNEERKKLLQEAVKRHDNLMNEARENAGCDRHLFGLYCLALEEGINVPDLYLDPSYFKSGGGGNFILSTSCTGFTPLGGGVAPMCENGYGVFYNILPNKIQFTVSAYNNCEETDANKYFLYLRNALGQMRKTLLSADNSVSKF